MTLNKILDKIKAVTESHSMVNYYFFGDPSEFLSQNEIPRHTSVLCSISNAEFIFESQTRVSFTISVMDWTAGDNYQDIWSDTLQISHDILAALNNDDELIIEENITLEPFTERFQDRLVGWTMNVRIAIDTPLNTCAIP
jgi:hypothetical protein